MPILINWSSVGDLRSTDQDGDGNVVRLVIQFGNMRRVPRLEKLEYLQRILQQALNDPDVTGG